MRNHRTQPGSEQPHRCDEQGNPTDPDHPWNVSEYADEGGATAIEYGLIAAGIAIAIIAAVNGVGGALIEEFTTIKTKLAP